MKNLMTPAFRVSMAMVVILTLAACDPTCNCSSSVDCFGDIDDVVRECKEGTGCKVDDKGNTGFCVETFPEEGTEATPP